MSSDKKLKNKRRRDSEQYSTLFNSIPVGVYRTTPDGRFMDANPALVELLGFPDKETLLRTNVADLFPDLRERQSEQQLLQNNEVVQSFEMRLRRYDGEVIWVTDNARVVHDETGKAAYYEGSLVDVTSRKNAEEALKKLNEELDSRIRERTATLEQEIVERRRIESSLRESERKYRLLFEESQDVIYFASMNGYFLDINQAGIDLFGFRSKEEFLKVDMYSFFTRTQEMAELNRALEEQGKIKDFEMIGRRRDGSLVNLLNTASAVRDQQGKTLFIRGILRDITANRKLEKQLFQAQKMEAVGLLASGVAHDFNNLLTVIMGNVELGLMRSKPEEPVSLILRRIKDASEKATVLTQKLLAFSRQQMLYMGQVHVGKLLRNFSPILERLVGPEIDFSIEIEAEPEHIWADPGALEQVVMNLIVNAREAMPQGGPLSLRVSSLQTDKPFLNRFPFVKPGRYIRISVIDSGSGMDARIQSKIFEPFFTTKTSGTGLGLSVVFGIVKQHKGYVMVDSKPGQGARFDVYLPCRLEGRTSVLSEVTEKDLAPGKGVVLLAEDDEGVREVLCNLLRGLGYSVLLACDGEEARQLFFNAKKRVDLLILDIIMPRLNGPQACEEIRAHVPDIPVLIISGYGKETRERHLPPGSNLPLLLKPINMVEFSLKIRELIASRPI